jgi:hypothetical protein
VKHRPTAGAGWTRRGYTIASLWLALLAACGGSVGTGGTGSFASGPITGFGSIIVDGVHYDESAARIESDDGSGRSRDDLRLGMVVEIDAHAADGNAATAERVRIVSELIGRVDAVGPNSLVINGVTARLNGATVFDASFAGGRAGVTPGTVVEVYGLASGASGDVVATRIEPRPDAGAFKFGGALSMLDTQARTFRIGSQTFVYPAQIAGSEQLANGALLRIAVEPQRDPQRRWIVTSLSGAASVPDEGQDVKANGLITQFTSPANFEVAGRPVDASGAAVRGGPLALGQRVKLEARARGGVLVATEVRVVGQDGDDDFEIRGRIVAIDPAARVFELGGNRGRVSYARNDIAYQNGAASTLAPGRRVTVTGGLSADGTLIEARRIRFDD